MKESAKKKKILFIEDDSFIAEGYQKGLKEEGFEVTLAGNGEVAFSVIANEKPDLILLDIVMAGEDGFSVLKRIKEKDGVKEIPVIILSNLGGQENIEKGKNLGAEDYLVKSDYSLNDIAKKIRDFLGA
jgi:DNA-binding response OmpR family regulator